MIRILFIICLVAFTTLVIPAIGQAQSDVDISPPRLTPRSVEAAGIPGMESIASRARWGEAENALTESEGGYSLDMLLGLASQSNPTIRQARMQISATLAQALQAGLYPNPRMTYLAENMNAGGTPGEFQGFEVEQRIVTANKLELSRNKYLQRAKVAEHLAVAQQFKVCNDVRLHFVKTLAAEEQLKLKLEMLETAKDHLMTSRELFNLGQANEVDLRKALADLKRHQLDYLSAQNELRSQFYMLTSLVGEELVPGPLRGSLYSDDECLIDFDAAYGRLLGESPEILAAYAKLKEDHITVHRENVQWVPDLVISGGPGYNFESQDAVANFSLSFEVPLYDRNQGTIRQAQLDRSHQQQEIRRTELVLRKSLSEQYSKYITVLQHIQSYEDDVLPESRKAYEQGLKSYQANREEWPVILMLHREYTMRRMEQVDNRIAKRSAEIMINGYLLHGGLEAAPSPTPPGHMDATPKPR